MIRNSTSGHDNDDAERGGRRPLVIDNQGRQMLNDIKNALSHHLKTNKPEGEMSPNIIKPISAPGKSRKAYNKQAMEAIHNSLRPFQHGKDEKNGHSSATSTQGSDDSEKNDDIIRQISSLSKQDIERARVAVQEPRNGIIKQHTDFKPIPRKITERSESPSINSVPNNRSSESDVMISSSLVNGDQTPPPVPPRAPIAQRSQSPPVNVQNSFDNSSIQGKKISSSVVKPLSTSHRQYIASSVPVKQAAQSPQPSPQGSLPVTPNRGMSPVNVQRPVIHQVSSQPVRVPTNAGGNITIRYKQQPPPPYPQTHSNSTVIQIHPNQNEQINYYPGYPVEYISTSDTSNVPLNVQNLQMRGSSGSSPMDAWSAKTSSIIMTPVKSQVVQKPKLQTATAPVPNLTVTSQPNFVSSFQAQINPSHSQSLAVTNSNPAMRDVHIKIMRHSNQQDGYSVTPDGTFFHGNGRPQIQINFQNRPKAQVAPPAYGMYDHFRSDNSTPRSGSPVSRTTNQSPMSMLSTASSPSTNSDVPDKPPPPYPGRHLAHGPVQIVTPIPQHQTTVGMQNISRNLTSSAQQQNDQPPLPPRAPRPLTEADPSKPPPIPPPPVSKHSQIILQQKQDDDTDTETLSTVSESSVHEKTRCTSPMPERKPESREKDKLRKDTLVRNYSPQAFKFFMEQHVENLLKSHRDREKRRLQLEREMAKVGLSEDAQCQMRRMLHQKESNYIRLKRAKMEKSLFHKIQTLGVGAFGEVTLVRKKDVGHLYAMKTLRKSDVLKRNQVAHVKAERDILAEADNEWVVKLYYSFQDRDNLYFVMDYVPGGDLMGLLIKKGIFEEPLAIHYIGELVLAIESVHKMGFIHRDIKPDNILIDRDGHIKLTDFGLCTGFRWTHNSKYYQKDELHTRQDSMDVNCTLDVKCNCGEIQKPLQRRKHRERHRCLAHSLVGTPNYIAPEVLLRSGYSESCDWWSVGVILYEMIVGQPPFYAPTPAETQYKVIHWHETLKIPREANLSQAATNLILRLCCGASERAFVDEIKQHPFFNSICFEGLRHKTPPYKPQIKYATDTSNFDDIDPDKIRGSDSEDEIKKPDHPVNGKHPEHAFFEFTFRRFFDDGGHPYPVKESDNQQEQTKTNESNAPVYV
ncbi:serine/threonine-protein kinase LATS1-like [Mytilus californianus]|uniref:serine/threonine-protein kinase LATS1-like n=1 Tax=Mytilus californianus TaxID=6549 RepID=UPI002246B238|nr:serine/threonine-protein kinase LATS1-like [Mytilus californianus]